MRVWNSVMRGAGSRRRRGQLQGGPSCPRVEMAPRPGRGREPFGGCTSSTAESVVVVAGSAWLRAHRSLERRVGLDQEPAAHRPWARRVPIADALPGGQGVERKQRVVVHGPNRIVRGRAFGGLMVAASSSMHRVIGPTPPGTGVIQPATSHAVGRRRTACLCRCGSPTSMITAPGLTMSAVRRCACPPRRHHDVGLARGGRGRRGAVADGHVALACSSIIAIGLPTMLLRPITTACLPRRSADGAFEHLHAAVGRAGLEAGLGDISAPAGDVEAVHVLQRRDGLGDDLVGR